MTQNPEIGRRIRTGSFETNVHDVGSGAPVLLIHGSGPGVSAWANWRLVIPALAKARRVVAPDMVGFGYTDRPAGIEYGMDTWVQPTIWTGLPETATVVREEIFGPCCHISPFDSEDEVINKANATDYGLSTTIWTTNLARAHRVAARIEVGITWINSWFLRDLRTAFGGSKQSGIGREGGLHSLEFYTELRNVMVKY